MVHGHPIECATLVACAVLLAARRPARRPRAGLEVRRPEPHPVDRQGRREETDTLAVSVIEQINQEFIRRGVTFVIQVGDLVNDGSVAGYDTRANFAQALYNAGIGFFRSAVTMMPRCTWPSSFSTSSRRPRTGGRT